MHPINEVPKGLSKRWAGNLYIQVAYSLCPALSWQSNPPTVFFGIIHADEIGGYNYE